MEVTTGLATAKVRGPIQSSVPEGWRHVQLTEVTRLESGHTPSKRQPDYWGGTIPWVSLHDTESLDAWEIQTTSQSITEAGLANSSARLLPKGTVVFSRTATVGKSTVMGRAMATSQDFACYVCGPEVHNFYLALLLRSMRTEWKKLMAGSIHNTVYMPVFKTLSVDLPPHGEQVAIANAMRDVERMIDSLEQLLSKKRQIKQGAMQELLTGKRRLEGFQQPWQSQPFNVVLERINAKRHQIQASEYQTVGSLPVVDQGQTTPVAYSDAAESRYKCPAGGALVFGDHTCITKFVNFDFVVGADGVQVLIARQGQSTRFHAYQLELNGIESTGYNRHFKFLLERHLLCPAFDEQTAIAQVLSDMDAEITGLESRLTKARALKQAMAQALLTGRIRIPLSPQEPAAPVSPPKGVGALGSGPARTQEPAA